MKGVLKIGAVIFGAVIITTLGIDAADTLSGSRMTLLGQLMATQEGVCPDGMQELATAGTFQCFDIYEASTGEDCDVAQPQNEVDALINSKDSTCEAVSEPGRSPWTFVNRELAQTACVRAGKRLPTNEEWQRIAVGTPDGMQDCNINAESSGVTGGNPACVSAVGAYDVVGNVWEWTSDDVFDGVYNGRTLPDEGYVLQVDSGGVATVSSTSPDVLFGEDYFWSKKIGAYAMLRGGFYGSQEDAGVYATHAAMLPTVSGAAIGFRCVR